MSRMVETLAYGMAATILVSGSLYALVYYAQMGAPPAASQAAPVAAAATPAARPMRPNPPVYASLPQLGPAPLENVVRTSTKTYYLPSVNPAQADADTFNSLRRNCYDAARNNSQGQYPALQQAACDSFAAFARTKGWDTGPLPAYGIPSPPPQEVVYQEESAPDNSGGAVVPYVIWNKPSKPRCERVIGRRAEVGCGSEWRR